MKRFSCQPGPIRSPAKRDRQSTHREGDGDRGHDEPGFGKYFPPIKRREPGPERIPLSLDSRPYIAMQESPCTWKVVLGVGFEEIVEWIGVHDLLLFNAGDTANPSALQYHGLPRLGPVDPAT